MASPVDEGFVARESSDTPINYDSTFEREKHTEGGNLIPLGDHIFRCGGCLDGESVAARALPSYLGSPTTGNLEKRACHIFVICKLVRNALHGDVDGNLPELVKYKTRGAT
jgi:hypothetical protein